MFLINDFLKEYAYVRTYLVDSKGTTFVCDNFDAAICVLANTNIPDV